jgi:lipopolysaccharide export system ATP-binding protein
MTAADNEFDANPSPFRALLEQAATGDRSLMHALAAVAEAADDTGTATLQQVSMRFREAHLAAREQEGRELAHEAGRLTMDEVRTHLATSLIPRLVDNGALLLPRGPLQSADSPVQLERQLWDALRLHRGEVAEIVRQSDEEHRIAVSSHTPAHMPLVTAPFGKTLKASGLSKIYRGRKVVNDVALQVQQGEIVGLLGPNGAGKTTTFYMLVGLIAPLEGRIELEGVDITDMPMYKRARQGLGYLSQEPSVFRKLSVEDNILAILETLHIPSRERAERLEALLGELGIKHLRHSKAYQLSGGERRRLEITRALVTRPHFMMLDEPFAGVDPIAVQDIQEIVSKLRNRGIGVLISDHNVEQTLDIVDRAYIMFEGRVRVSGTVRELVFDDTVARDYLGPTLSARLRARLGAAEAGAAR